MAPSSYQETSKRTIAGSSCQRTESARDARELKETRKPVRAARATCLGKPGKPILYSPPRHPTPSDEKQPPFSGRFPFSSEGYLTLVGKILCRTYESLRSATRVLGVHLLTSMSLSMSTTYFPSGFTFTKTYKRVQTRNRQSGVRWRL